MPDPKSSIFSDPNYLDVTYSSKIAPVNEYPNLLAKYIHDNYFFRPGFLLDVGCGRGDYLHAFTKINYQVEGLDLSPQTGYLKDNYQIYLCNFESEEFPNGNGVYDYIFCKSVIEHLHHPEFIIQNIFHALKPGGKAIIMTPSWAHTYWGPFFIDHTHVTPFTHVSLHNLLEISGFREIQVDSFVQLPLVWKYPILKGVIPIIARLPIPYRPFQKAPWPEGINKTIRFSKEIMLLASCMKPYSASL